MAPPSVAPAPRQRHSDDMAEPDPPVESAGTKAVTQQADAAATHSTEIQERVRRTQDEARRAAAHVSEVESQVADTMRRVAATADEQGRSEDATRLRDKADNAARISRHEADAATDG